MDSKTKMPFFTILDFLPKSNQVQKPKTKFQMIKRYDKKSFFNRNKKGLKLFTDEFIDFLDEVIEGIKKEIKECYEIKKKNPDEGEVVSIFESKIKNTDKKLILILLDGKFYDYTGIILEEIK